MVHVGSHADCTASNRDYCRVTIPSKMLVCMACTKIDCKANASVVHCTGSFSCAWTEKQCSPQTRDTIQHI